MQHGWIGRHLLRHETELDERAHVIFKKAVVDLVDVRKVIDGGIVGGLCSKSWIPGLTVRVVKAHLIHQDAVKTNRLKVGRLLDRTLIVAIALTQREDRAPRTKSLLPVMREGRCGGLCVDGEFDGRRPICLSISGRERKLSKQ